MRIKDLLFGGIFVLLAPLVIAQTQITWGKEYAKSGGLINVLPLNPSNFYTVRWQGTNLFGSYYLNKFDELNEVKAKKISTAVNNNLADFEDVILIEERPAVILSNVKDGKDNIFLQQYSYDLEPRGEAKLIASYDLVKGKTKDPIQIIQSKDKKFTAIIWLLVAKKKNNDIYGFKVFDTKLNIVQSGEYEIPFESRNSLITNHYLTNTGDFFFTLYEFDYDNYRNRSGVVPFRNLYLYQVRENELSKYKLPMNGRRPEAISISSDENSIFTITGCYGDENVSGISGVFYMKVDFINEELDGEGFTPFDRNFITQNWSDKEVERLERKIDNGSTGEPNLYNYSMRESHILPDGSIVGLMEQYFVQRRSYYDMRGYSTFNYIYHYNDIVAFKFTADGEIEWIQNVPKRQVSTNDGGPYSSYAFYIDGSSVNLIFNDSKENYSEAGQYIKDKLYVTSFAKKNNVVAHVKIDLYSGLTSRDLLTSRKEIGTLVQPKLFTLDEVNKEMIVFSVFKSKERFGVIKF